MTVGSRLSCLAVALVGLLVDACGIPSPGFPSATLGPEVTAQPGQCLARHVEPADPQAWEPDPACTPGATEGGLSLSQLCPVARTRAIRPPVSYTEELKRRQLAVYGYPGIAQPGLREVEEDHLIPLELGGAPSDERNLWPQPGASPNEKDRVEDAAHSAVCSGRMSLPEAQQRIAQDWYGLGRELGVLG